jgi:hypothetical protein
MEVISVIVAIGLLVAGVAAVFLPAHNGDASFEWENLTVKTTVTGVALAVIGVFVLFAGPKWFGASREQARTTPHIVVKAPTPQPALPTATPFENPEPPPGDDQTGAVEGSAATDVGPAAHGPWEASTDEMQLVVERIEMPRGREGRARIALRLTNVSEEDIELTADSFLATDEDGAGYKLNPRASGWSPDFTLVSGERVVGTIELLKPLPPDVESLDVSFNGSFGSLWPERYVTINVAAAIPQARKPAAPDDSATFPSPPRGV